VQELLDKEILAELAPLLEITVVVVVVALEELVVHATQKLQDTADREHLTLYQDHCNIMQAEAEQA
jgi:hypothetical protein